MATLESYGKEVHSIFQLLGEKENDITLSISWALTKCPEFMKAVVSSVCGVIPDHDKVAIQNQKYDADTGITDIEVTDRLNFHIIFEAKRGWILPGAQQLTRYSLRIAGEAALHKHIVSLSECTQTYAGLYLPFPSVNGIPVSHLSYKEIYDMAVGARAASNHEQKHLLAEFCEYLRGIMTMQKSDSNMVYVVALSDKRPEGCSISWIDIVLQHRKYFCPAGVNGWPKEAPNYIAFRYAGRLQSIHHIEGYTVTRNMHTEIPEMPDKEWDTDHYVYRLGPAIIPSRTVKTGKLYKNGRVWAMLDTLLTCDSISEARDLTKTRLP
jgi:hypothetical protein